MYYLVSLKIGILSSVFIGLTGILPCFVYLVGYKTLGVLYFIIWGIAFVSILLRCFAQRIFIDETGVKYISLTRKIVLKWDEILEIGMKKYNFLVPSNQWWIYFSTEKLNHKYLYGKPNEKLILMHYRKNVISDIKNYWDGDIDYFDSMGAL